MIFVTNICYAKKTMEVRGTAVANEEARREVVRIGIKEARRIKENKTLQCKSGQYISQKKPFKCLKCPTKATCKNNSVKCNKGYEVVFQKDGSAVCQRKVGKNLSAVEDAVESHKKTF